MPEKPSREVLEKRIRELEQRLSARDSLPDRCDKTEDTYYTIFNAANDAIVIHDAPSGRVLDVNQKMTAMYGYSHAEALQLDLQTISEGNPPYSRAEALEFVQKAASGRPQIFEWRARHKNGTLFWVEVNLKSVALAGKKRLLAVVRDISQRKQAESKFQESEAKYRLLIENVNDAIFIAQDNTVKFPNPKTIEILGYAEDELSAIPFVNLIHPEDREMVARRHLQRLRGEQPTQNYSFRVIDKGGNQLWVQINAAPITWDGRPATINMVRDITFQKQLEDQVRQAHKMESIGTLAGGIAHEFNNMLGVIIGNTELALDDIPEWNPAADCIREIRAASLRAKDVVRKLLSVARKSPQTRKPVQIRAVVDESLGLLRKTISAGIEIRTNLTCTTETVLADPVEINQVLMDLCTNAVHAMAAEEGVLQVSLEAVTLDSAAAARCGAIRPGRYAQLKVTDNGCGIDADIIDRVFDPYFTTKDVDQGLGMGLAVVHGIVRKHDGSVSIDSRPNRGTTVEVLFPLLDENAAGEPDTSAQPATGSERILFVDDEPSLEKLVTQMLKRAGYDVVGKTKSLDALQAFEAHPDRFDLVISDMAMPEMAGDRLAREIIRIRPDTPIILCTGHSERMDESKARELGIKGFVMKPLTMADLTQTVRRVLNEAKGSET